MIRKRILSLDDTQRAEPALRSRGRDPATGTGRIAAACRSQSLELLIGAAIVLLATVLLVAHQYTSQTFAASRNWSSAADELRVRITESHLWLEERLSGDRTVDVRRQVFDNVDGAQAQCRALVAGGRTQVGAIERLPAGEARASAARTCREIALLRAAATSRLSSGGKDVGTAPDQAYDALFVRILGLSRTTQRATQAHVHDRNVLAGRANVATIAFLFLLLAAIIFLVRRHRARLERLSRRSDSILDSAGEGIYGLDRTGRMVFVNAAAARLTGHRHEELIGRREHELVEHELVEHDRPDGSPRRAGWSPARASLEDGTIHRSADEHYRRKDGTSFPVEYTSTPIVEEGRVEGAVVVFKDISERRAAEAALAASERGTRQILETAHDAFVAMDADGLIIDWNPQAQAIFGWSREEATGRDLAETIIPEHNREAHRRGLQRFLATGEGPVLGQRIELGALHRSGREFPVELTISALTSGTCCSFTAFVRDISEGRASEQLLERQRQQLVEAQSVGGFGSWEWDVATGRLDWSDELCRIYGLEPDGRSPSFEQAIEPVHPDDRARLRADVGTTLEHDESLSSQYRIVRPDGSVRIAHIRGELARDEQGTPLRMVGTVQDITERLEVERAKDEFVSVVSHELRTPLTSIRGSLGLLESGVLGALPEGGQRMIEIAVQNTDRLVRLINDILDIERINSGNLDMHQAPCQAAKLVERAVEELGPVACAAKVQLVAVAVGEPAALLADPDRVHQTLTNLISNAVKFSPAGSTVRVSSEHRDREVLFQVGDEGRGIPADKLASIFERFQQVDASDSREKGGTGLGLAICRTIVEHHGGRIWAQSELGSGSTFSFVLPALRTQPEVPAEGAGDGPSILLCDDDPAVLEVVGALLTSRGYRVIETSCGEQALRCALIERPAVILLDLLMPGMSGWETAAELKRRPETADIPIVVLSVLTQAEAEAPGGTVVGWLEKPPGEAALFAALERAVDARSEPFRVLVVEDDPQLADVLAATFRRHGVETFHAGTGPQAIELSQQVLPDLLVLEGRIAADEFEDRVMGLLAQLTTDRTPEGGDEPEAHPVGR